MRKIRVLGISAGQGALLYPFRKDKKFKILANLESRGVFHTTNEEQWQLNFKNIPFLKNLDFIHDPKITKRGCDIIVSSPDCGASSIMRLSKSKQLGDPKTNKSLNMVLEAIKYLKPKVFLIENLPRLLTLIPGDLFEEYFHGYSLIYHNRSVSEYGNSQVSRNRLVIIGVSKETHNYKKLEDALKVVFKVHSIKITRDILELPQAACKNNYMIPLDKKLAMYDYRKLPDKINLTVKEIHDLWSKDFSLEKKWPIKTTSMKTLPGVYRLEEDKHPLTLRPSDRQFRPDGWPLGIEDFKKIMGFPKSYKVYMDNDKYLYWLNKARYTLSKGSVYEIGIWFKRCLGDLLFS